jgi:hypothetical protein
LKLLPLEVEIFLINERALNNCFRTIFGNDEFKIFTMANIDNQGFRDRKSMTQNTTNQNDLADGVVKREVPYDQSTYQDGYWHGRNSERRSIENLRTRESESAASGLLIGILLAGLCGLGAVIYFINQNPETQTAPVINVPAPAQSPQPSERIIERVVPVPQNLPDVNVPAPKVNITVPSPAQPSSTQTQDNAAPQTQEAAPAPENSPQ